MCWVMIPTRSAVEVMGSRVGGSPMVATSIAPPSVWATAKLGNAMLARAAMAAAFRMEFMVFSLFNVT